MYNYIGAISKKNKKCIIFIQRSARFLLGFDFSFDFSRHAFALRFSLRAHPSSCCSRAASLERPRTWRGPVTPHDRALVSRLGTTYINLHNRPGVPHFERSRYHPVCAQYTTSQHTLTGAQSALHTAAALRLWPTTLRMETCAARLTWSALAAQRTLLFIVTTRKRHGAGRAD